MFRFLEEFQIFGRFSGFWTILGLLTFVTLITILTLENLNSWQSLFSDNQLWHWTAFAILAMFLLIILEVKLIKVDENGWWLLKSWWNGHKCMTAVNQSPNPYRCRQVGGIPPNRCVLNGIKCWDKGQIGNWADCRKLSNPIFPWENKQLGSDRKYEQWLPRTQILNFALTCTVCDNAQWNYKYNNLI